MIAIIRISVSPSTSTSSLLIHQKPAPIKRCTRMVAYSTSHDIHLQTTPLLQIRSSIKLHKVFEDRSSGIVCYRDGKGEITCEGYDEGPRYHQGQVFSTFTPDQRDAEVIDLLHRRLLQIVDKKEAKNAAADKDDLNSNNGGFNTFY